MVARNHLLASIVDEFVRKHPRKQRDAAERARMDSEDKVRVRANPSPDPDPDPNPNPNPNPHPHPDCDRR